MLYEVLIADRIDTVFNPVWKQGCYVIPTATRLGVVSFNYRQSIGINQVKNTWTYEATITPHIILSGLLVLAAQWHWAYAELDIFISSSSGNLVIDLNRVFGIHLALASITCFTYGIAHLSGTLGPGI